MFVQLIDPPKFLKMAQGHALLEKPSPFVAEINRYRHERQYRLETVDSIEVLGATFSDLTVRDEMDALKRLLATIIVPRHVADAGDMAARRYANFIVSIENGNTRAAYACA